MLDIAVIATLQLKNTTNVDVDKVTHNDITYNRVFPYEATPQNGRAHKHHGQMAQ